MTKNEIQEFAGRGPLAFQLEAASGIQEDSRGIRPGHLGLNGLNSHADDEPENGKGHYAIQTLH